MPLVPDMRIYTDSKRVRKARLSVLEFLLMNHPLDCPVCDQGGECDLQDITLTFGSERGRFYEYRKRSVDSFSSCAPFIKTVMTRCIHCTRCVRFLKEVSGVFDLGVLGRGNSMEIGTYINRFINDELSGNIIDLCPVGALTSMPYAFHKRSWENDRIESVDVIDSLVSSVRFDVVEDKVVRVLPGLDENVNGEWITNKARFSYDSFYGQRIHYPSFKINGRFIVVSWKSAFEIFIKSLERSFFSSVSLTLNNFIDLESAFCLQAFLNNLGCSEINYENHNIINSDFRFLYLFNTTLTLIKNFKSFLFFNVNLRFESPVLNSRLRKLYLKSLKNVDLTFDVFSFGGSYNYSTFPIKNLGSKVLNFKNFFEGKSVHSSSFFGNSGLNLFGLDINLNKKLRIFFGTAVLNRPDFYSIYNGLVFSLSKLIGSSLFVNHLSFISTYVGSISSAEISMSSYKPALQTLGLPKFNIFVGTDSKNIVKKFNVYDFNTYLGFFKVNKEFYDKLNLILPISLPVFRKSFYLNLEGRIRKSVKLADIYKLVLTEIDVVRVFFDFFRKSMPSNFSFITDFNKVMAFFFNIIDHSCKFLFANSLLVNRLNFLNGLPNDNFILWESINSFIQPVGFIFTFHGFLLNTFLFTSVNNYYFDDLFSKNSKTLTLAALDSHLADFSKTLSISNIII